MNEIKFYKLQSDSGLNNPQIAEYLEVNARTIRRWRSGETEPPISVIRDLENYIGKLNEVKDNG